MKKLAALLRENHKEMAWLEAMSMGRPVSQYFDAFAAAEAYESFAEAGYDCQGTSSLNTPGFLNMTFRQPYGVVGSGGISESDAVLTWLGCCNHSMECACSLLREEVCTRSGCRQYRYCEEQ